MAIISPTTQLQLISKLSPLTTVSSGDLHVIQRDLKTYKISNANYIDSIIDSDIFEQVSDSITIKGNGVELSKLESIPTNGLLGRTTAGIGDVEVVDVVETINEGGSTHDNIPTELAVYDFVNVKQQETLSLVTNNPYYECIINSGNGLTLPSEFQTLSGSTVANYRHGSYGSIIHENNAKYTSTNSLIYYDSSCYCRNCY